jgi:hypothetical protein
MAYNDRNLNIQKHRVQTFVFKNTMVATCNFCQSEYCLYGISNMVNLILAWTKKRRRIGWDVLGFVCSQIDQE